MSTDPAARSYRRLFWALALLGAVTDIASKYAVFAWLPPAEERVLIPRVFSLVHQSELNRGALFGLGNDPQDPASSRLANLVFTGISFLAVLVIIGWSCRRATAADGVLCTTLGLVLAGALGNLYDRVWFGGVRDWIWVYYQSVPDGPRVFNWPVFNIADSCLVCGAILLLLQTFFSKSSEPASPQTQKQTAQAALG